VEVRELRSKDTSNQASSSYPLNLSISNLV
jgi:hypothetical protein